MEGEKIVNEVGQGSGQMAVITPKAVSETLSRRVQMKATTAENRLVRVDRFLTIVGDKEVKPDHECSISIPNNNCKIVLQMQERFASAGAFSNAKAAPKAFFYDRASLLNTDEDILYIVHLFPERNRWTRMVGCLCDNP